MVLFSGPDFAATWSGKPGRKYQSKKEQLMQKVGIFAHEIYSKYFKEAVLGSYGAMGKLRDISSSLDNACKNVRVCCLDSFISLIPIYQTSSCLQVFSFCFIYCCIFPVSLCLSKIPANICLIGKSKLFDRPFVIKALVLYMC